MQLEIYALKIPDDLRQDHFDQLVFSLPEENQTRIKKFINRLSAIQTLCGELLIRSLLSKRLRVEKNKLQFNRTVYGKPYCLSSVSFFYNISHAGNWVVCAIDSHDVGIDVELVKDIDLGIAERFFSRSEYETLSRMPEHRQRSFFYELWTLKESYIKAEGKGLSIPLDSFSFSLSGDGEITCTLQSGAPSPYSFKQFMLDDAYKCAVCSRNEIFPEEIETILWNDLYNWSVL